MKMREVQKVLSVITADQWGMVTTAQAASAGIGRLEMSRLESSGYLERVAHGVYRVSSAPSGMFESIQAAWISTEPKKLGYERIIHPETGVIIAGISAAALHQIGDFWVEQYDFITSTRRQSQRPEIRFRRRQISRDDVTLVEGLPVLTIEYTIADLVDQIGELSLVGEALAYAAKKYNIDWVKLAEHLSPFAARYSLPARDGQAFLEKLQKIAHVDVDSIAKKILAMPQLAQSVAKHLQYADLSSLISHEILE